MILFCFFITSYKSFLWFILIALWYLLSVSGKRWFIPSELLAKSRPVFNRIWMNHVMSYLTRYNFRTFFTSRSFFQFDSFCSWFWITFDKDMFFKLYNTLIRDWTDPQSTLSLNRSFDLQVFDLDLEDHVIFTRDKDDILFRSSGTAQSISMLDYVFTNGFNSASEHLTIFIHCTVSIHDAPMKKTWNTQNLYLCTDERAFARSNSCVNFVPYYDRNQPVFSIEKI